MFLKFALMYSYCVTLSEPLLVALLIRFPEKMVHSDWEI